MTNRPAVPADIEREILLECGHRCAVCGTPFPLERAHIIPWHQSREHKAEDMICLCANCHERADNENWGEKTLREYKRRPWVMRQGIVDSLPKPTATIILVIENIPEFGERDQSLLTYAIAGFLSIPPHTVRVTSIEQSSIEITVELPEESAEELLTAYKQNNPELRRFLAPLILLDLRREAEDSQTALSSYRDIILEIRHRGDQTIADCEFHFEVAEEVQKSIRNAKRAAFQLLDSLAPACEKYSTKDMPYHDDNYGVSVYLEDYTGGIPEKDGQIRVAGSVEDESLGLAIALGIIHRFLGYDCQERSFAAIGKIVENGERTYSLGSVEGIHGKVYAACDRRIPIPIIIVPAANEPEASRAKEEAVQQGRIEEDQVEIFGVNSLLEAALYAFQLNLILFHCNHIFVREQRKPKNFCLKELEDLRGLRMIVHPYFNNQLYSSEMEESNNGQWENIDSEEIAKWVAVKYAERWLNADLEERETIPSPVILNTHGGNDPIEAIKSALQSSCSVDLADRLNIPANKLESHVLSHSQLYLDKGRFTIFVKGFNPYEMRTNLDNLVNGGDMLPSLFAGDGILSKLLESPRRRNVVLVCCETMRIWFKSDRRTRNLARHFTNDRIHKCYRGTSTPFDKYVSEVAADYTRIITCRRPPSIETYKCVIKCDPYSHIQFLPPHVFFYGEGTVKKLFLDTYISEIRGAKRQPQTLYRLLKERTVKRFLILGDGNTGKSTLLLKTLHDCKRGCLPYVPVLARLRGRLASTEDLYELMAQECKLGINEFRFALKYTKDLLVMLDGLNESEMELEVLTRFAEEYKERFSGGNGEHSALILTSRSIPRGLQARGQLQFAPYGIEDVSIEQAADTLKFLFPERAGNILTALTGPSGDREILANPFMFTLLCGIVDRSPELSDLTNLTRTEMRQKMVEDWLDREGERQKRIGEERDLLKGTRMSLSRQVETCIRARWLTRRENYLCHLAFAMVTDENNINIHISYGAGVACIQKIIKELDKPAVDPERNEFHDEVAEDLFEKLVSGSLLRISPSSEVSFEHESIRDFMAAECLAVMLTNAEETADDTLNSFISKAPKYSDLLSFTCGCLEPEKAEQIVIKILEKGNELVCKVNRLLDKAHGLCEGSEKRKLEEEAIKRIDERKDFLEYAVECCVENRQLDPEIIDLLGVKLAEQIVYTDALTDRRDLGNLLARLGRSHHNSKAFKQTLCILQGLAHTFQKPALPKGICPERENREFFFSQTIVEILGFLGFPEDGVIKALTDYFRAPVGNLDQEIHEKYPWRALEAFAALEWNCNVLKKLLEWIGEERSPEIAAFGWHAVGALGHPSAVSMLQERLEPDFQEEISDFLSEAPPSVKGFAKDLEGNTGLREVLLEFVRSQNREERWCPVFLALLSGLELGEILSNVADKRVEDLLKYRWQAAEVIVRSKKLESKFYPLERCLRDYKNYFFAEWAERQASSLESSARDSGSPKQILKKSLKRILSIDRKRVEERLGDIDSLTQCQIQDKIKSCIDEGERRDTGDRGFTWSSLVILGVPFKMVTSYDQLREMFIEAERELWEQEEMRRKDSKVAPLDTYPRDILKKLMDEKELEERVQGQEKGRGYSGECSG